MLKILYTGCFDLSTAIPSQFSVEMCLHPKIAKNSLKTSFWEFNVVQGHLCC